MNRIAKDRYFREKEVTMDPKLDKDIRVLAFTCCGHCPIAIVELRGKCEPMEVYCPLQKDGDTLKPKLIYKTSMISSLHPDCPLPTLAQLEKQCSSKSLKDAKEFIEYCNRVRGVVEFGQGSNTKKDLDEAMPNRKGGK